MAHLLTSRFVALLLTLVYTCMLPSAAKVRWYRRYAEVPKACQTQTTCPQYNSIFLCGVFPGPNARCRLFCSRLIGLRLKEQASCYARPGRRAIATLVRNCELQCWGARNRLRAFRNRLRAARKRKPVNGKPVKAKPVKALVYVTLKNNIFGAGFVAFKAYKAARLECNIRRRSGDCAPHAPSSCWVCHLPNAYACSTECEAEQDARWGFEIP